MKPNKPTLMWGQEYRTGDVWHQSFALTKPMADSWPCDEMSDEERSKHDAENTTKLYRVTIEAVPEDDAAAYLEQQTAWLNERRIARGEKPL